MDKQIVEQIVAYAIDEASIENSYDFRVPPTTVVGDGISTKIGEYIEKLNSRKVFIVTDKQIVKLGLVKPMLRSFERHGIGYTIFDEVEPDPADHVVQKGIARLQECKCDSILTFGGGSVIDAGKAIAILSTNPFDISKPLTDEMVKNPRLPLVAVPTTAGTGSEVTDVSIITDTQTQVKVLLQHPALIPDMAVIDPRLTLGIPPQITAATGIDVLAHAIESYLARGSCTLAQALSQRAMRLVGRYLRTAVGNGSDMEARHKMAIASYMAGMSFSNAGLGLCHAMAHQVGARYKIPHGVSLASLLPEVMRFNMLVRTDRLCDIARAFDQRIENLDPKQAAYKSIDAVRELIEDIGLSTRLRDIGAQKEDFEELAKQALEDPTIQTNPRAVRLDDIIQIFERAY